MDLDSLRPRANARNVSFRISLRWPIHIINPVVSLAAVFSFVKERCVTRLKTTARETINLVDRAKSFWICEENSVGKSLDFRDATVHVFEKLHFQMFSFHTKRKCSVFKFFRFVERFRKGKGTYECCAGKHYEHKWWNKELTLKCKFKCYVKPMKNPLGVSSCKGNQGTTRGKEKNSPDLGGTRTHDLRVCPTSYPPR